MNKIVGIIPARYESSRFPGKPLAEILGKPMIWWVYQNAKKCKKLDEVYVATDSKTIQMYCQENDLECILTGENPTGSDRVAEANVSIKADYVVNIQGDEPLITHDMIEKSIEPAYPVTNLMAKASIDDLKCDIPKVVIREYDFAMYLSRFPVPAIKEKSYIHMKQVCVYGYQSWYLDQFKNLARGKSELSEGIELLRFIEHRIPVKMIEVRNHGSAVDYPGDIKKVEDEMVRQKWTIHQY